MPWNGKPSRWRALRRGEAVSNMTSLHGLLLAWSLPGGPTICLGVARSASARPKAT
jgi:hypothetical protein